MNLQELYQSQIVEKLAGEFGIKNKMAVPYIQKIVINMGIGDSKDNKEDIERASKELAAISGQRPSTRLAKKSVAGFSLRKGEPVGLLATLRGKRMYDFLERLIKIVLPRLRDFRGMSRKSFDLSGNYTVGFAEHTVFPEIDLGKVSKTRGLEVTLVIGNSNPEKSRRLLEEFGMPFEK